MTMKYMLRQLDERLKSAIIADDILSAQYAESWNNDIRAQYGEYPEEMRTPEDYKNMRNYGSVYYYGRTLKAYADEIGELCNFSEPARFADDDLYEFYVENDGYSQTYGLVNLSRAHRDAEIKTREYEEFMGFFQMNAEPDGTTI